MLQVSYFSSGHLLRRLNFALGVGTGEGFIPLADATPFGDLLGAKYARAVNRLRVSNNQIQLTDLSFGVLDELVPAERLDKLEIEDVIRYRKASENAREAFLEHLVVLQAKQATIGADGDYSGAIRQLVTTEIIPAKRIFKDKLRTIGDNLFGTLATGTLSVGTVTIFQHLSWENLIKFATGVGTTIFAANVSALNAERAAKRECSIFYLLSLDN